MSFAISRVVLLTTALVSAASKPVSFLLAATRRAPNQRDDGGTGRRQTPWTSNTVLPEKLLQESPTGRKRNDGHCAQQGVHLVP